MGIDVYGRGTYAGGQLNSYVAAAAALREGVPLPHCEGLCTAETPADLGYDDAALMGVCQYANALNAGLITMSVSICMLIQSHHYHCYRN